MIDKREEDILDDILDSEESEDSDEMKLPETLMGESVDEEEDEEPADPEPETDLSKFLDEEKDEEDEKDEKKPDEAPKKSARELDREEMEREIRAKIAQEKKEQFKVVQKIAIVCAAVVLVIGIGLFAFFQMAKAGNNYIVKFDGKKIGVEEFEFFLLRNVYNQPESPNSYNKQLAYNGLLEFLVLNKAAKAKNVVLNENEKDIVKSNVEDLKNFLKTYNLEMPKISDDRAEEIIGNSVIIYYKLVDIVAEEFGYTVDENDFAAEFAAYYAAYQAEDKLLKFIMTNTMEEAEAAHEALAAGMAVDEAIEKYSALYGRYGVETLDLSYFAYVFGFDEEKCNSLMKLNALEFSDVMSLGNYYGVLIAATYEETRDSFRSQYIFAHKTEILRNEYELWKSEAKVEMNEKVFESFDVEEFFSR